MHSIKVNLIIFLFKYAMKRNTLRDSKIMLYNTYNNNNNKLASFLSKEYVFYYL